DCVTSLGGVEVAVDKMAIDYAYSATQKCLGAPPGLSPVAVSPRGMDAIRKRKRKPTSWYLDLELNSKYWLTPRTYHHTAPVSMILGLREALRIVLEEGLQERFARHKRNADSLKAGLEALGLTLLAPEGFRLPQVTSVRIPEGVDDAAVRKALLREHSIEIGKGFGQFDGKIWRIGLMGESSKAEYVLAVLSALEEILPRQGYEVAAGAGVAAASKSLGTKA
ncbi:MAG: aminotransferase class V-fold PLP-dependent enzyme, partial [Chloroflexi bacterium]|nr:aminotransferase class V-fold PLP-dependent enzyme [Chloroflexota bacterium]